jgi:hypothetical protein
MTPVAQAIMLRLLPIIGGFDLCHDRLAGGVVAPGALHPAAPGSGPDACPAGPGHRGGVGDDGGGAAHAGRGVRHGAPRGAHLRPRPGAGRRVPKLEGCAALAGGMTEQRAWCACRACGRADTSQWPTLGAASAIGSIDDLRTALFAAEENVEEFDAALRRWREEPEGV